MKLNKPIVEEGRESSVSVTKKAKDLAEEVQNLEKKAELEERLKPTAEKIIEQILLGERQPIPGMELDIKLNGKFTIFGFESTKDSYFRYVYPQKNNGEAPQETEPEATNKKEKSPEPESQEELIYLD